MQAQPPVPLAVLEASFVLRPGAVVVSPGVAGKYECPPVVATHLTRGVDQQRQVLVHIDVGVVVPRLVPEGEELLALVRLPFALTTWGASMLSAFDYMSHEGKAGSSGNLVLARTRENILESGGVVKKVGNDLNSGMCGSVCSSKSFSKKFRHISNRLYIRTVDHVQQVIRHRLCCRDHPSRPPHHPGTECI